MGYGDQIIGTGLAKGAHSRGKRVAFGDGKSILWDHNSELIFRHNPNIAPPGSERDGDLEWIEFYRGHRGYNHEIKGRPRWGWNMDWRCTPGEFYFTREEQEAGRRYDEGFILIEPYVEFWKRSARNKDWGVSNYHHVARRLTARGYRVAQFSRDDLPVLDCAEALKTKDFRDAAAILSNAWLYIGPEGGLHHAAAAVNTKAVVIFGSWIPPSVTGYDMHTNIVSTLQDGHAACGAHTPCPHCIASLKYLKISTVLDAATAILES